MMKQGIYTIDSLENGTAKLLWRDDESVEELIEADALGYPAKAGDLVEAILKNGEWTFRFQENRTESIRSQARKLREELLKRNKS